MAYSDVAELSGDSFFINRVAACYAIETGGDKQNPQQWAMEHNWEMAAQPGFGEAYTYAKDTDVPDPGKDVGVITDNQILGAVQSIITEESS
jgi:hypothetical protein